ncbi:MAG: hypothetical protein RTV41_13495 [Candidatus Thorarchaeota archaeon]
MTVGRKIADNQRNSYLAGLIVGLILYLVLLSFNDWNPVTVVTSVVFLEFSVVTGLVMRFLSGLGLALTYATFCVFFFRILSPTLKGKKSRTRLAKLFILVPALILVIYSSYKIWSALVLSQPLSYLEFLSTIFGVWSLMILVYTVPLIKGEYTPDLGEAKSGGVQEKVSDWKFSLWKGYQSRIKRDYGRVAEGEFERYGSRLFTLRVLLSGLLLLPISLILFVIPPLGTFGVLLWFRVFSLHRKHFSPFERGLLILVSLSVALVTTISFLQTELVGYALFFDTSYGLGLLTGLILLFAIISQR